MFRCELRNGSVDRPCAPAPGRKVLAHGVIGGWQVITIGDDSAMTRDSRKRRRSSMVAWLGEARRKPARRCTARIWALWLSSSSLRIRMSSSPRWRSGPMVVAWIIRRLLSYNEAGCLIPEHTRRIRSLPTPLWADQSTHYRVSSLVLGPTLDSNPVANECSIPCCRSRKNTD